MSKSIDIISPQKVTEKATDSDSAAFCFVCILWGLFLVVLFAESQYFFVGDVVVVVHHLIDDTVWCEFDFTVADGLDKFVVVARHQHNALEGLERVVERLN